MISYWFFIFIPNSIVGVIKIIFATPLKFIKNILNNCVIANHIILTIENHNWNSLHDKWKFISFWCHKILAHLPINCCINFTIIQFLRNVIFLLSSSIIKILDYICKVITTKLSIVININVTSTFFNSPNNSAELIISYGPVFISDSYLCS